MSGIRKEKKSPKNRPPVRAEAGRKRPWQEPPILKKIGVDPKLVDRYDTDDGGYSPKGKKGKYPKA